jgi:hypothetical protein
MKEKAREDLLSYIDTGDNLPLGHWTIRSYRLCMFNLRGLKETICSNAGRPCGCGLDPSLSCTNHTHSWLVKEPVGRKQLARRHEDQETIR